MNRARMAGTWQLWLVGLLCLQTVTAFSRHPLKLRHHLKRQSYSGEDDEYPPGYNFSMPVDHFDSGNTQTYNNRFYVNDTYYQPGGPVILFDVGEAGVEDYDAAYYISEYGTYETSPMRLAARVNAIVIVWEHRYYGESYPVPRDRYYGVPSAGISGYAYLNTRQSMQDLQYFANHFNQTKLTQNNVDTSNLDPYHTPWIIMGVSYSGMRAVWARNQFPETFYAAWSSSAPVNVQADGSIYYNEVYRSMPSNCTKDVQAVVASIDKILDSGDAKQIASVKSAAVMIDELVGYGDLYSRDYDDIENWEVASTFLSFTGSFQYYGPAYTTKPFCDGLESFDAAGWLSGPNTFSNGSLMEGPIYNNSGRGTPSSGGVVATSGQSNPLVGLAAYVFGAYSVYDSYNSNYYYSYRASSLHRHHPKSRTEAASSSYGGGDDYSWSYQVLTEMGMEQGSNVSSPLNLGSKFINDSAVRDEIRIYDFTSLSSPRFRTRDFPTSPNLTEPLAYGTANGGRGWNMRPSNVMFTNGEFDPWRAFSVASREQAIGAPERPITTTVPECNKAPAGSDVFGLLYPGAVHGEDLTYDPESSYSSGRSSSSAAPLTQGVDLFVQAWDKWLPCFNDTRDAIRTGSITSDSGSGSKVTDGGSGASTSNNSSTTSAAAASGPLHRGAVVGCILTLSVIHALTIF